MFSLFRNNLSVSGKKHKTEVFPKCTQPLSVLFITDTHGHLTKEKLDCFLNDINTIDAIFLLGDISDKDHVTIQDNIKLKNIKKYGILGNHDYYGMLEEYNVMDLNGNVVNINEVSFCGIHGSIRYKSSDAPMLTNKESLEIAESFPKCDILVTHDKAGYNNTVIDPHGGLYGIMWYIKNHHPAYHIHGHLHEDMEEKIGRTSSIGICRCAYARIDKYGMKILKLYQ